MRRTVRHTVALTIGGIVLVVLGAPAGAGGNPPGNNGTVKIDKVVFDDLRDNEPHTGCTFQVDFYGFDQGDLHATVTFTLVPPTGRDKDVLTDQVAIGEDPAGGGTDLDASATYDLSNVLAGVEPHAQQGIHLRLTVHAEGSQGADTKFKEFWVTGCGVPPSSTTTMGGGSTTIESHGTTTTTQLGGGMATTMPGPSAGVGPGGALPKTGSSSVPLAATGVGLVALGSGAALGAKRLKTAQRRG